MSRVVPLAFLVLSSTLPTGAIQQPVRDPSAQPAQPTVRRIPVGTASITGTVTDADSGRPIAGVRVTLNGTSMPADAGAGIGPGPIAVGVPVGIGRGIGPGVSGGGSLSLSRTALTDAQGRFSIQKLPAGQFSLNASRGQFITSNYGAGRAGGQGTAIRLVDGQAFVANLELQRGGVIAGTVFSETGEPEPRAQVRAMRVTMSGGVRRLQTTMSAQSDDRGLYRMFGLQPGEYVIAAQPSGLGSMMSERQLAEWQLIEQAIASGTVQPPSAPGLPATVAVTVAPPGPSESSGLFLSTYYPATLVPSQATTITIDGTGERSGIDLQVLRVQSSGVDGTIGMPSMDGVAVQVSLVSADPLLSMVNSTRPGADGRFQMRGLAPGKYTVFATTVPAPPTPTFVNGVPTPPSQPPRLDDAQKLWARAEVMVEPESNAQVNLSFQPGRSISGVVLFDMDKPPDLSRSRVTVTLNAATMGPAPYFGPPPQTQAGPDGRFTLNGVVPGTYVLRATGNIKSSIVNGQDTLDFPLDFTGETDVTSAVVTLTDRTSELSGTITDEAGRPAFAYTIIAAAADPRFWTPGSRRVVTTRPDTSGRYVFRNLPQGDYLLAAVTDLEPGRQFDPELLRTLAAASMRVSLSDGAKLTQSLRVGR
jgi:hypothetical protein